MLNHALTLLVLATILFSCDSGSYQTINRDQQKLAEIISEFEPGGARGQGGASDSLSEKSFQVKLQKVREQLTALESLDTAKLNLSEKIDWRFAYSILKGNEIELTEIQPWKKDPRWYMTFTGIPQILEGPEAPTVKTEKVRKRLKMAVVQMANGSHQLQWYVPRFQELGLFMAENSRTLFEKELPEFIGKQQDTSLHSAIDSAYSSLQAYIAFLKNDLIKKPIGDFAIGSRAYNALLKNEYLLEYDADSLYAFGLSEFQSTVKELVNLAEEIAPGKDWKTLAKELKKEYPEPHSMIPVHQDWVDKSRAHVIKNNLIPIPWKERVVVVERAPYLRKTSYYGHFSFAKEKDKDSIYTSEMHINPFEDQWSDKQKEEYLLEHDWGVIRVTAPHETYAGHHIQGLYQANNPRPLRKNNSISIFSEGWGLYNEQLMRETGFFPEKKIQFRQLQLRLWRNARVVYDVGMHTGKMSYDDAVALMTDEVGFLRWASQLEIDASCASPGYFIGYFTGMMEILKMREEYKNLKAENFSLSEFHEKLLKAGSMPIPLMRLSLFKETL